MRQERLPEWRYNIRRFFALVAVGGTLLLMVNLITSTLGVDICAEDICYEPFVTEGSE